MKIPISYANGIDTSGDEEKLLVPAEVERRLKSSIQPFVDRESERLSRLGYVPEAGVTAQVGLLARHGLDEIKVVYFAVDYPLIALKAQSFEGMEWEVTGSEFPDLSFCSGGTCEI